MIENVYIKLDWIDCQVGSEESRFIYEHNWSVLDEILAGTFIFPALKYVEIALRMGYGWVEIEDNKAPPPRGIFEIKDKVVRMAGRLLPRVSASRSVKVNIDLQLYNSPYASKLSFVEHS